MTFSERSTIGEIYANEQGRAVLEQYLPKLVRTPTFSMTFAMRFETVCKFRKWKLKRCVYEQAVAALGEIEI